MRGLVLGLLVFVLALPATAAGLKQVTVEQLEQAVAADHDKPDAELALELAGLELTERLSAAWLKRLEALATGDRAEQALQALADESAFLDLPAADLPADAAPGRAEKIAILDRAIDFVGKTVPRLPNFFATRDTTRFEDTPAEIARIAADSIPYKPLHAVDSSSVIVLYRDGHELVEDDSARASTKADGKKKKHKTGRHAMSTAGEFGPILTTVVSDAVRGQVIWSHWEQGAAGQLAVFRYTVPKEASHYAVTVPGIGQETQETPAYHGEIAVNPADGSILRMTMQAELNPASSVARADLMVDYGPVEIGGKPYICPVRSVALSRVRMIHRLVSDARTANAVFGPFQTRLNDVVFTDYHLFRVEMRILTDDASQPQTPQR